MKNNIIAKEAIGVVSGLAAGAGLMYLLDPDRGARRRARLRRNLQRAGEWTASTLHDARKVVPKVVPALFH
ncbi:MAG TPA: hypothetical protein VI942_03665 [Thermoanaerobaculia bacterium]|nr:hypothetical protein [Thermoanaerobaculia bacterium]